MTDPTKATINICEARITFMVDESFSEFLIKKTTFWQSYKNKTVMPYQQIITLGVVLAHALSLISYTSNDFFEAKNVTTIFRLNFY